MSGFDPTEFKIKIFKIIGDDATIKAHKQKKNVKAACFFPRLEKWSTSIFCFTFLLEQGSKACDYFVAVILWQLHGTRSN